MTVYPVTPCFYRYILHPTCAHRYLNKIIDVGVFNNARYTYTVPVIGKWSGTYIYDNVQKSI